MDLTKSFDTRKNDLWNANFYAYGFNKESLKLLYSYLSNRWHDTEINKQFRSWQELILGVIFINNINVCNFADSTTFFACAKDLKFSY